MTDSLQIGDGGTGLSGLVFKANQSDYVDNQLAVLSESRAIVAYNDAVDGVYNYKLKALAISGGAITAGNEVTWPDDGVGDYDFVGIDDIAPLSATQAIAVGKHGGDAIAVARIITLNDMTLTIGNAATVNSSLSIDFVVALSSTTAIVFYDWSVIYAKVATISGSSVSLGAEATLQSELKLSSSQYTGPDNWYDKHCHGTATGLTSTTAIAQFWWSDTGSISDANTMAFVILSVNGTNVAGGTPVEITTTPGIPSWTNITKLSATKALATFRYYTPASGQNLYAIVLDVSGTTITPGEVQNLPIVGDLRGVVTALSDTQAVLFYRRRVGSYDVGCVRLLDISGTEITCGPELQITTNSYAAYGEVRALNSKKALGIFLTGTSSIGDDKALVFSKVLEASVSDDASAASAFNVSAQYNSALSEGASVDDFFTADTLSDSGMAEELAALNSMIGETTMDVEIPEEATVSEIISAFTGESLLIMNFDGADGATAWAEEAQGLTPDPSVTYGFEIDTAEYKFGVSSLKGAGGIDGGNNFGYELPDITTGDITLHGWVKFKGLSTWAAVEGGHESVSILYLQPNGGDPSRLPYIDFGLYQSPNAGEIRFFRTAVDRDNVSALVNDDVANPFTEDTWTHVAIIVSGRNVMLAIGGLIQATWPATIDDPMAGFHWMQITGGELPAGADFWVDGLELLNYAKWTADFTPPTEPSRGTYYSFLEEESIGLADGPSWLFPKTINDLMFLYDTIENGWAVTNTDTLDLADTTAISLGIMISDWLTLVDTQTNNWNGKEIFTDTLSLYDIVSFGKVISDTINESLVITDVATYKLVVGVLEHLGFTDLATALKTMAESSTDSLGLTDGAERGFNFTINEALAAVDTVSVVATFLRSLSDKINIADAISNIKNIYGTISEALSFAEVITTKGALYTAVYDTIAMNVLVELADDIYECYVLNTPKFLPSMYSGFNFNSYCVFENRAFAANDDGIYELTGETDAGVNISTGVIMSQTDFGMPNQKRFRRGYIGISGTSPVMVLETEDGSREAYAIDTNGKFVASHDLKSKRWKLSVANFDELDCIKLIPVILTK